MDARRIPQPQTYTAAELEHKAHDFLSEHVGKDLSVPVDVELILEKLPGVTLEIWPGLCARLGIEGMVARNPETGELFVYIDDDLADYRPNRYRFTVAEELAHLVIHRRQIDAVSTPEDFRELMAMQMGDQMERNAKRFAAAVLMPHSLVDRMARQMYPRLVQRVGFTNPEAVKKYLAAWLARQFEVSVETMSYRLREWPVRIMARIDEAMRNRFDQLG